MIFHISEPPRLDDKKSGLEITHKIVVDDTDLELMPEREIESYFPNVRSGFFRKSITRGHDQPGQQTLFMVIDQEIGVCHGR